jgi:hypothetical protein
MSQRRALPVAVAVVLLTAAAGLSGPVADANPTQSFVSDPVTGTCWVGWTGNSFPPEHAANASSSSACGGLGGSALAGSGAQTFGTVLDRSFDSGLLPTVSTIFY